MTVLLLGGGPGGLTWVRGAEASWLPFGAALDWLPFLGKEYGGNWYQFNSTGYSYDATTWYHIDFTVVGTGLTCTVTDPVTGRTATVTATESYFSSGYAGATGENGAEFDNFTVTAY